MADDCVGDAEWHKFRRVDDPTPTLDTLGEPKCEISASNSPITEVEAQSASALNEGYTATNELLLGQVAY